MKEIDDIVESVCKSLSKAVPDRLKRRVLLKMLADSYDPERSYWDAIHLRYESCKGLGLSREDAQLVDRYGMVEVLEQDDDAKKRLSEYDGLERDLFKLARPDQWKALIEILDEIGDYGEALFFFDKGEEYARGEDGYSYVKRWNQVEKTLDAYMQLEDKQAMLERIRSPEHLSANRTVGMLVRTFGDDAQMFFENRWMHRLIYEEDYLETISSGLKFNKLDKEKEFNAILGAVEEIGWKKVLSLVPKLQECPYFFTSYAGMAGMRIYHDIKVENASSMDFYEDFQRCDEGLRKTYAENFRLIGTRLGDDVNIAMHAYALVEEAADDDEKAGFFEGLRQNAEQGTVNEWAQNIIDAVRADTVGGGQYRMTERKVA